MILKIFHVAVVFTQMIFLMVVLRAIESFKRFDTCLDGGIAGFGIVLFNQKGFDFVVLFLVAIPESIHILSMANVVEKILSSKDFGKDVTIRESFTIEVNLQCLGMISDTMVGW